MATESERKIVREKFKEGYLETKAGSRLKFLGVHPAVRSMLMVVTEDGWTTTVDRDSLVQNEAFMAIEQS